MRKLFELIKQLSLALVIWGLVLAPMAQAQSGTSTPPANSFTVPPDSARPPVPKGEIDPANYWNPPNQATSKKNEETLRKWREEDQRQCEIEAKGGKKNQTIGQAIASGVVTKPLRKAVNDKIGIEVLPNTLNQSLIGNSAGNASHAIQNNLREEFQTGFKTRWGEEFPKTLAENMESYNRLGYTADYLRQNQGQFKQLMDDSIRESLPKVINRDFIGNGLSTSINRGLRENLQDTLKLNLKNSARPTIETYYRLQLRGMFEQIPDMIETQINNVLATIEGTKAGATSILNGLKACALDWVCAATRVFIVASTGDPTDLVPEIDQVKKLIDNLIAQIDGTGKFLEWVTNLDHDKLLNDMLDGLTLQLEQSITDPKHINRLTDAMMRAIEKPINESMENSINKVIDSISIPTKALEDAIDTFDEVLLDPITTALDQQLNIAIATITGPIQATIDGLGNTIASTIDNTLGETFYSLADGFTGTASELGNAVSNGITGAGNNLWGALYPFPTPGLEVVSDDYANTHELAGNQMAQSNYDVALANGIRLTPDQNTIPQPGEMTYDAYASTFDDGGPVGGISEAVAGPVAQATEASTDQVAEQAINNQVSEGQLGTEGQPGFAIAQSLKGGFTNIVSSGVGSIVSGVPFVGPLFAPIVEQLIAQALGAAGVAPVAGGLPVMDVGVIWSTKSLLSVNQGISKTSGKILSAEEQIKDLNEKMTTLQIQTCTNLKVMRRIQLLNEEKQFIWDADARKAQAAAINDYLEIIRKQFNTGVAVSPGAIGVAGEGNGQSVVPRNAGEFVTQRGSEARAVALNDLKTRGEEDPDGSFLQKDAYEKLMTEEFSDPIQSDWTTKEEYDNFTAPGGFESGGWDAWLKIIQPKNNPQGSLNLAKVTVDQAGAQAAAAAQAELDRGDGFLGVYDCPEEERVYFDTENSTSWYCRNYTTKTPPGLVRDVNTAGVNSTLRQLEQGNNSEFLKGEVNNPDNLPSRVADYRDYLEKDKAPSIFNSADPCPNLGPCPDSGWKKTTSSINLPPSLGGDIPTIDLPRRNNFEEPETSTESLDTNFTLGQLLPIGINFTFNTASLAQINAGAPNLVGLQWNVVNADTCQARNDWLSGASDTPAVNEGDLLELNDSRTMIYPIRVFLKVEKIENNILNRQLVSTSTTPDKLAEKAEYRPAGGALAGERYRLTLGATNPRAVEVNVATTTSGAGLIQLFKNQIETAKNSISPLADMLKRHDFTYGTTDAMAFISVKPKLNYILKCFKGEKDAFKELNITRN